MPREALAAAELPSERAAAEDLSDGAAAGALPVADRAGGAVSVVVEPTPVRGRLATEQATGRYLAIALLATLVLWNVPYGWAALYPFKLFATWLHETSHGIAMLVTGAGFARMEIFRDTSGLAYPAHGVTRFAQAAISSAGYMGTAFFGALFLALGRTPRGARAVLAILGVAMATTVLFFVRNTFGIVSVAAFALLLLLAAWKAGERLGAFVLSFLAAQSCINAVLDIRVLFGSTMYVNGAPHGQSDAHTVARVVGGPYWMWAALWLLWSFALFYAALRIVRPARDEQARAAAIVPGPFAR